MTKEEFLQLQTGHQESGLSLKSYLQQIGTSFSTYNYWRKKYLCPQEPSCCLAPIRFRQSAEPVLSNGVPSGAMLLFPNGLRAHFGAGSEAVLRELLNKSLSDHVLP